MIHCAVVGLVFVDNYDLESSKRVLCRGSLRYFAFSGLLCEGEDHANQGDKNGFTLQPFSSIIILECQYGSF